MWHRFTAETRDVILHAQQAAQRRGESVVQPDHLLAALCEEGLELEPYFQVLGTRSGAVRQSLELPVNSRNDIGQMSLGKASKECIDLAWSEARRAKSSRIEPVHMLIAVVEQGSSVLSEWLSARGGDPLGDLRRSLGTAGVASPLAADPSTLTGLHGASFTAQQVIGTSHYFAMTLGDGTVTDACLLASLSVTPDAEARAVFKNVITPKDLFPEPASALTRLNTKIDPSFSESVAFALDLATERHDSRFTSLHLLYGLCIAGSRPVQEALKGAEITAEDVLNEIQSRAADNLEP